MKTICNISRFIGEIFVFVGKFGLFVCFVLRMLLISCSFYGAQNETYIEGWEKKASNLLIYKRLCKI